MYLSNSIAFTTGLISFLAPCVIPLLPAYLTMITGMALQDLETTSLTRTKRLQILYRSLMYVAGFSSMFVLLGLGATAIGQTLIQNREVLIQIAGLIIMLLGVFGLGMIEKIPVLQRTFTVNWAQKSRQSFWSPFIIGVTFALAWTPCAGAILGGILTLAATQTSILDGGILLLFYSLGISLPFFIISVTTGYTLPKLHILHPYLPTINRIGAILLIVTGALLVFGFFNDVTRYFLQIFSDQAWYQSIIETI